MHYVTLHEHGKHRSQEHICSSSDACGISNRSVQGDEPGKMEAVAVTLGQTSFLIGLTKWFGQKPVMPEE